MGRGEGGARKEGRVAVRTMQARSLRKRECNYGKGEQDGGGDVEPQDTLPHHWVGG